MGEKIKKWLFSPAKNIEDKVIVTLAAFLTNMIWLILIIAGLNFIHSFSDWRYQAAFYACILAPLWEELAFRVIPMSIAKKFGDQFIIPVLLLSSLIFGWGHGNGTNSLLIQGVGGLLLGIVYIKTNYSYWCVVAMHASWNIWAIFFMS